MNLAVFLAATTANPFMKVVEPIVDLLDMVLNPALLLVGALGAIYCVLLGVKLAKAEEPQERDKAKNALKNALIGFVLIFVLILALRIALPAMQEWLGTATAANK